MYMFYSALQQLFSHTTGEQSPSKAASSSAAQLPSGPAALNPGPPPSCGRQLTARSTQALARIPTPQPRRTAIGHFGFHAVFLLARTDVSQEEGVPSISACRTARPTERRFSPPPLRLRKASVLGQPRRGPQLRLRTAFSPPPLPPHPRNGSAGAAAVPSRRCSRWTKWRRSPRPTKVKGRNPLAAVLFEVARSSRVFLFLSSPNAVLRGAGGRAGGGRTGPARNGVGARISAMAGPPPGARGLRGRAGGSRAPPLAERRRPEGGS